MRRSPTSMEKLMLVLAAVENGVMGPVAVIFAHVGKTCSHAVGDDEIVSVDRASTEMVTLPPLRTMLPALAANGVTPLPICTDVLSSMSSPKVGTRLERNGASQEVSTDQGEPGEGTEGPIHVTLHG